MKTHHNNDRKNATLSVRNRNLSTLRQFAASARFDGNVRSETSGGVSAVQRHQRMRAHENSHSPCERKKK